MGLTLCEKEEFSIEFIGEGFSETSCMKMSRVVMKFAGEGIDRIDGRGGC